jgi:hypothetical protein
MARITGKLLLANFTIALGVNSFLAVAQDVASDTPRNTGAARVVASRPANFPHRIWAACDFERSLPDYAWWGLPEKGDIPSYPGNATALVASERPYQNHAGLMVGINPVPGPKMGEVNQLYLRYRLEGATEATFQYFSLTTEDNNHIRASGLTAGRWAEATLNFTRDAVRNDGTPGVPFQAGERMDDLKIFIGLPGDSNNVNMWIDDVIFFADDPSQLPEPEPFPNRVLYLAAFDTGITPDVRTKYWPGEFEVATRDAPADSNWGVARAVPRKESQGKWIRLQIEPTTHVGVHTKLRFRFHLTGASNLIVQIFDATDQDNRHVRLTGLQENAWQTVYVDFTNDARRNDGSESPFAAGHVVDDLFFLVEPGGDLPLELFIDEVVLYDAGEKRLTAAE